MLRSRFPAHLSSQWNHILSFLAYLWQYLSPSSSWLSNSSLMMPWQVPLMIATAVCVALGMGIYNMKWNIFEEMIKKTVGDAGVSILILLLIGMMSATWMISGVVPTLIYYGVQIMSPTFFLPCACIISSIISVMTGTSWTTIATIGESVMPWEYQPPTPLEPSFREPISVISSHL